jgi:hypothetical protein
LFLLCRLFHRAVDFFFLLSLLLDKYNFFENINYGVLFLKRDEGPRLLGAIFSFLAESLGTLIPTCVLAVLILYTDVRVLMHTNKL